MSKEKIQSAVLSSSVPPVRADSLAMGFRFNPKLDAKLDKFMADNPEITEYYTRLVKEHPDRAVRTFALRSMFKHEDMALKNALQMPQVKEWVGQYPGLEEQISAKIRTTNPIIRAAAFIKESLGLKRSVDMATTRTGLGVSM